MDSSEDILQEEIIVIISLCIYHPYFLFWLSSFYLSIPYFSQSCFYLFVYSVQLMSIMDHYGYATRPLVEYNLDLYTEKASFLGWLGHMSERRRLAITSDPAASEPARFKNKKIQASENMMREESEPEIVPISPSSSTKPSSTVKSSSEAHPLSLQSLKLNQLARIAAREAKRKREADSEDEYKPPVKVAKAKSKRSSPRSKAGKTKLNTSAYGNITDDGGKCPRHHYKEKQEASDSDTSLKSKKDDKESHSDSFTDS